MDGPAAVPACRVWWVPAGCGIETLNLHSQRAAWTAQRMHWVFIPSDSASQFPANAHACAVVQAMPQLRRQMRRQRRLPTGCSQALTRAMPAGIRGSQASAAVAAKAALMWRAAKARRCCLLLGARARVWHRVFGGGRATNAAEPAGAWAAAGR